MLKSFFLCLFMFIGINFVSCHDADGDDHDELTCDASEMIDALMDECEEYEASVEHENQVCDDFVASVAGQDRFCRDMGSDSDTPRRRLIRQKRRLQLGDFEDSIYVVPIIFNILYKEHYENIPMSQIDSQMDVINQDFRSINYEFSNNLNDELWNDRVGDSRLKFVKQAVYRYNMPDSFSCVANNIFTELAIKSSLYGGINSTNPKQFLNFWVCSLSGASGYAYFPCLLNTIYEFVDGIVQDYRTIGSKRDDDGTFVKYEFSSSRDYGHTGSHEIGHYLNLPHIWGNENGCENDDFVNDTPAQDSYNIGCPNETTNSCQEIDPLTGVDMRDMYENIMDYSSDTCRFMFSAEQATRMRAVLETGGCRTDMKTEWRPPAKCDNNPCLPDDAGSCAVYHGGMGCSQCEVGSFKRDYNYPCVDCQEAFGSECLHCADLYGCRQCVANTHNLVVDSISGLSYCEPTPCYYPDLNCRVCNNGECTQCNDGYVLHDGACYES